MEENKNVNEKNKNLKPENKSKKKSIGFLSSIMGKIIFICVIVAVLAVAFIIIPYIKNSSRNKTTIVSTSTLQQVLKIGDLSTCKSAYNGIVDVKNEKGDKILYHVSYDSDVKIGFNAENIKVDVNDSERKVVVTLPEMTITDVNVKMESLDYIFEDDGANTPTVSNIAYAECINDAKANTENNDSIYSLAKGNSEKMIKALLNPLLETGEQAWTLEID